MAMISAFTCKSVNDCKADGFLELLYVRKGRAAIDEDRRSLIGEAARMAGSAGEAQRSHLRIRLRIAQWRPRGVEDSTAVGKANR